MDIKTIIFIVIIVALVVSIMFESIFAVNSINNLIQENNKADETIDNLESELKIERDNLHTLVFEKFELQKQIEELEKVPESEPVKEVEPEVEKGPAWHVTYEDEIWRTYDLSELSTNVMCFMDYTTITDTNSDQYKIQQKLETNDIGIRCTGASNNIYAVAMGSAFGRNLGDVFKVTLENGHQFYVVLAEFKDDGKNTTFLGHECENRDGEKSINVIEFIVDSTRMPDSVLEAGTYTALDIFGGLYGDGGNIKTITYEGHGDFFID